MSNWEHQYREEVSAFTSPQQLDTQVLQQAKRLQPKKDIGRILSRASLGCATIAAILMLVHPAQHLGALTPRMTPENESPQPELEIARWQPPQIESETQEDPWQALRNQVTAGNYIALCQEWRLQQRTTAEQPLPRELRKFAQKRCRILH
ncbi:hypothetical protein ACJJIG_14590 [Microbulbifer sp. SSSA007]|uniref:hypothetical protein n=1 Tax=Microbulbifer TaxID=48073 RepID=UPI000378530A|nr:hypothetical protein [Microbulbifer variabilis]